MSDDRGKPGGPRVLRDWRTYGPLVLAAVFLSPALRTGYWAEDVILSLVPGELKVTGMSLGEKLLERQEKYLQLGRFFPVTPVLQVLAFALTRDVVAYKAYLVAGVLLDLMLFQVWIRRLSGDADFACLATCLTIGLFQFRVYMDPILAYYGQMQLMIAAVFVSLLALQHFLEGRRGAWLLAAAGAYLTAALTYEITYLFVPIYLLVIHSVGSGRRRWLSALPFVGIACVCVLMTIVVRRLFPNEVHYIHHISYDPRKFLVALVRQLSAGLPLSYFLSDLLGTHWYSVPGIFPAVRRPLHLVAWAARPGTFAVALTALTLGLACLRPGRRAGAVDPAPRGRLATVVGVGLMLAVLPAPMVCVSEFHRRSFSLGVGWIPVLLQYYGVALVLTAGLWRWLTRPRRGGAIARWEGVAAALALAALTGLTSRINREVAVWFNAPPGTREDSTIARDHCSAWHFHRLNLEAALHAGLMDEVPATARVQLAHDYRFWHGRNAAMSRYFYAMHTSKAFAEVSPQVRAPAASGTPVYRVRDVITGRTGGYVVLSPVGSDRPGQTSAADARGVRVFVRHPRLWDSRTSAPFLLVGSALGPSGAGPARPTPLLLGRELGLIRSGRDWAIFEVHPSIAQVEPDSLTLITAPRQVAAFLRAGGPSFGPTRLR
jgi:hypothetical protein